VYILLLAPRPAGKARATSIPAAVCKERATQPAGLRAAARRGADEGSPRALQDGFNRDVLCNKPRKIEKTFRVRGSSGMGVPPVKERSRSGMAGTAMPRKPG